MLSGAKDDIYKQARRQNLPWSLRATKWLLSILSAITTGVGLAFVFTDNAKELVAILPFSIPPDKVWMIPLGVAGLAGLLTVMIQAMVLQMWERVFTWRPLGLLARLLSLVMALGATLTSILFASGTYRVFNDIAGITAYINRDALQASDRLVKVAQELVITFSDVATRSRDLANKESKSGGTCEGTPPKSTCGMRCRLRKRIATEAEGHNENIKTLKDNINTIIQQMKSDNFSRDAIKNANDELRKLRSDKNKSDYLEKALVWASQNQERFAGHESFVDPDTGMQFRCRDKKFADKLARLKENLASMQRELTNINFVNPQGMPLYPAILQIIEQAWNSLTSLDFTRMPGQFWVAAAVDVSIILLIFIMHAEWDAPTRAEYERFRNYRQIRPFILPGMEERFLLVPVDGHEGATRLLENVALLLRLKQPPELSLPISLDDMDPDIAQRLSRISGGATAYHFYSLPDRKKRLLDRYLRRLAMGDEIYAPPSLPSTSGRENRPPALPAPEKPHDSASA